MAVEIVKAKPQPPSKFLVIGEPFSGKTTLASKAPSPIFISTDGNAGKAGLTAINVKTVEDIKEALSIAIKEKEYKTIVIDTIEGIVDLFTAEVLAEYSKMGFKAPDGSSNLTSLQDIPYGKATGTLNKRISGFAETLATLNKNVIVISYTKRKLDELTNSIILDSELKNIRLFTRFMDAQIIAYFDGEKHKANVISKRETVAGNVNYGEIEPFLAQIGWTLPTKSVRIKKGN